MRFTSTAIASLLFIPRAWSLVAITPDRLGLPSFCDTKFDVVETPEARGATVLEAPVGQDGVKLYIAIDSDSFQQQERPGNGGIRLLNYESKQHAIDDAVRLAKGMTRKHDMFRTGFSGAKVVVDSDHDDIGVIEREALMQDAGKALEALEGKISSPVDKHRRVLVVPFSSQTSLGCRFFIHKVKCIQDVI